MSQPEVPAQLERIPRGEPYAGYFRDPKNPKAGRWYKSKRGQWKRVQREMSAADRAKRSIKRPDDSKHDAIEALLSRYRGEMESAWQRLTRDVSRALKARRIG